MLSQPLKPVPLPPIPTLTHIPVIMATVLSLNPVTSILSVAVSAPIISLFLGQRPPSVVILVEKLIAVVNAVIVLAIIVISATQLVSGIVAVEPNVRVLLSIANATALEATPGILVGLNIRVLLCLASIIIRVSRSTLDRTM